MWTYIPTYLDYELRDNMNDEALLETKMKTEWQYYNGSIILQDSMGSDLSVVNAAKVSFNKSSTELTDKDQKLINYLAEHKHMSPFRHVQFSIILKDIPEFVLRQLYKHQVGISYTSGDYKEVATVWNEVSGRYVEFKPSFYIPDKLRVQHKSNKQASYKHEQIDQNDQALTIYKNAIDAMWQAYSKLLEFGVCKEQARMVLPLSFNTSVYWTASLEALVHFIKLRTHESAQVEIQTLAEIVYEIVKQVCPISTEALIK